MWKWLLKPLRVDALRHGDFLTEIECECSVWSLSHCLNLRVIPRSVNDGRMVLVQMMCVCVRPPPPILPSPPPTPHHMMAWVGLPPVSDPVVRRGACEAS